MHGKGDPLLKGVGAIQSYAKNLEQTPGVYRMLDAAGNVLYVGKAKNLKRRVFSYTQTSRLTVRLQRMVASTHSMEFIQTHTETEALLLEATLIKRLKPRFNILLRDDKSFPYILLTKGDFPARLVRHRGRQKDAGLYFGPFASAKAVNESLEILTRVFRLRTCADSVYSNRSRPCLQYDIKRCSAPCVGKISKEAYAESVEQAADFLKGKTQNLQKHLAISMQESSQALEFERAAYFRDQIAALTHVQSEQGIELSSFEETDIFAAVRQEGQVAIQVFFFRNGANYGNCSYFPRHDRHQTIPQVLSAFMAQFYINKHIPSEIIVNSNPSEKDILQQALTLQRKGRVHILAPQRGPKKTMLIRALANASDALRRHLAQVASLGQGHAAFEARFKLSSLQRIEVYDNSHLFGTNPYGVMVVAGPTGFDKSSYRKFSFPPGSFVAQDDYAMMRDVFTRRFAHNKKWPCPDLLVIDGGKGHLSVVRKVLEGLGYPNIPLMAVAKGPERNAGKETLFFGTEHVHLSFDDPALFYIQRLRDEAHRFAIGTHRQKRQKGAHKSLLDTIPNIGPKRRKALLSYFGSTDAIRGAGIKDLEKVEGISHFMAKEIYDFFHTGIFPDA